MVVQAKHIEDLAIIFDGLIVIETRHTYDFGGTEYLAIGEPFDEVPEGQIAPMYEVRVDSVDGSVVWEKRDE